MGIYAPRVSGGGDPSKATGTITVANAADQMAINSAGTKLYIVSSSGVRVISLASKTVTNTITSTITLGGPIGISPDGTTLYALTGNPADSTCPTFSLATETQGNVFYTVHTGYPGGFFASNSTSLYALHTMSYPTQGRFYSYLKFIAGVQPPNAGGSLEVGYNVGGTGAMLARSIAVADTKVFICCNSVGIVDLASWTLTGLISGTGTGGNNYSCALSPDKTKLYTTGTSGGVQVVNAVTNTFIKTITSTAFSTPYDIVFNNSGTKAYVSNYGATSNKYNISVIDTATDTVTGTIETTSTGPLVRLAKSPNGTIYAASSTEIHIISGGNAPSANLEVSSPLVRSSFR